MDILHTALGIIDTDGIAAHFSYRHAHIGILVFLHIPVRNSEAGTGKGQTTAIDKLILGDMSFSDDSHDASLLIVLHRSFGFQTHDIVIDLVADDGISGDIHQSDGLWHNQVGGHLLIDIDGAQIYVIGLCCLCIYIGCDNDRKVNFFSTGNKLQRAKEAQDFDKSRRYDILHIVDIIPFKKGCSTEIDQEQTKLPEDTNTESPP